ncbi:mechanosensitive ion channel family protein [Mucilaginibacter rubeus]|uniref:Mechanosensitive ion channel family protein n=1 Tax=Mucilaginibacter rubeus TaxID=2027860 RepID=A0AAE6MIF7_9SPHI|nr:MULTISPECIES: mechanosensitive ion channel family protein [Mucilaginibacter]QEM04174.1 mechanosensitive ion channel family protein [Mucilaginibacter rubeus]QEM16777.1 mechanosensitive ion channel family protein [Mucilaginibacter gossypii]QTE46746.1 mechanosensitive ion channel family protein [Mucilaginibacter rubeus]QTE53343.1 mechanosensitive ion channel family protein [Mucilaginibacter rubeus]QTE58429.1 mechanosensitive ion channel family protein [Mucilaginibacter rubeus]
MNIENSLPPDLLTFSQRIPSFAWNLIIALVAVLVGLIIKFIITRLFKFYAKKADTSYSILRSILVNLGPAVAYFIPLFLFNILSPLMRMNPVYYKPLDKTFEILLTISFAGLLVRSVRILEDYIYHTYDLNKVDNLKERKVRTQIQFIRKIIVVTIIFLTIAIILLSFESMRKIGTGLLTGVGIGGIIVGFAAQSSLGNLLAGFQIAFTQPIRIDDVLVVEGEWGRVEEITLTYVVLKIWDERRLILPINYFIQKPFQNWTRTSADILGTVFLYMDHTAPIDAIREEFERLIVKSSLWDKRVKVVQVTDVKEHTIEIRVLMSSRTSSDAFDLRCYIRENLVTFIQKNYPDSLPRSRNEISNLGELEKYVQPATGA